MPNPEFTQSATTRMANNQRSAARATMPLNQMAQASLRHQTAKSKPSTPPVGNASPQQGLPLGPTPTAIPTGGPQAPPEMSEGFDPVVFAENKLDQLVGEVRMQQFLESPRVKDGMEAIRFKNVMNANNPRYQKDSRNLFQQLVGRMGMNLDDN